MACAAVYLDSNIFLTFSGLFQRKTTFFRFFLHERAAYKIIFEQTVHVWLNVAKKSKAGIGSGILKGETAFMLFLDRK